MKRMLKILLLVLMVGLFTNCYAVDGDKYNDGSWRITSSGDLLPVTTNTVDIGSTTLYPAALYLSGSGRSFFGKGTTLVSSGSMACDFDDYSLFSVTPIMRGTLMAEGGIIGTYGTVKINTTGTSYGLEFGQGFRATGSVTSGTVSAKIFTVTFVNDGVNWDEISRTTAYTY